MTELPQLSFERIRKKLFDFGLIYPGDIAQIDNGYNDWNNFKETHTVPVSLNIQNRFYTFGFETDIIHKDSQKDKQELADLLGLPVHQIAFSPTQIHGATRFAYFDYSPKPIWQSILQTTPSPWIQAQLHNIAYDSRTPVISPHLAQNPHLSEEMIRQTLERCQSFFKIWENDKGKTAKVVNMVGNIFGLPKLNASLETTLKSFLQQLKLEELNDEEFKNISYPERYPVNLVKFLRNEVSRKKLLIPDDLRRQNKDEESITATIEDIKNANLSTQDIEVLAQQFSFENEHDKYSARYSVRVWSRLLKDPNTPDHILRQFENEYQNLDKSIKTAFLTSQDSGLYHNPRLSREFFSKLDWGFLDEAFLVNDNGLYLLLTDPNIPAQVQTKIANKLIQELTSLSNKLTPVHKQNILKDIFSSLHTSSEVLEILLKELFSEFPKEFIYKILPVSPNLYINIKTNTIDDLRIGNVLANIRSQSEVSIVDLYDRINLSDTILAKNHGDQFLPKLKVLLRNTADSSREYSDFIHGFDFSTIQMDAECLELLDKVLDTILFEKQGSLQKNLPHLLATLDLEKYYQVNPIAIQNLLNNYKLEPDPFKIWSEANGSEYSLSAIDYNILKFSHLPQDLIDAYSSLFLKIKNSEYPNLKTELFPIIFENPCFAHLRGHLVDTYQKAPEFSPLKQQNKIQINQTLNIGRPTINNNASSTTSGTSVTIENTQSIRSIYQPTKDFSDQLNAKYQLNPLNIEHIKHCPWQILNDIRSKMEKDIITTQEYLRLQYMLENPANQKYFRRFGVEYFIKNGEVNTELLLRVEKYFPIFQQLLDLTDLTTTNNRFSALAKFDNTAAATQGVAQYLNPINPKGLPQLIARCQEFVANDSGNLLKAFKDGWNNGKNGLEVLVSQLFANLELSVSNEEPKELKLYFRNIKQGIFTSKQIDQISDSIGLQIDKEMVGKTELFSLSIALSNPSVLASYLKYIQTLLVKTLTTTSSVKLTKMPDYSEVFAITEIKEIRDRDMEIEKAYRERIHEIELQMEKHGSINALSKIELDNYDRKLKGEIDLPEPNELEQQLLADFERRLGTVSDNNAFDGRLGNFINKLIENFAASNVPYQRRKHIESLKQAQLAKLSSSLEKAFTISGDQAQVDQVKKDRQIKYLVAKSINFIPIKAQLESLREKINQNELSATALEYMDLCIDESNKEWASILTHTKSCFTISAKLINKDYLSTDKEKNQGFMYDTVGNPKETTGILCILDRIEQGLFELLCKLPPEQVFEDLHYQLLDKYIEIITLISYLNSLKFGG